MPATALYTHNRREEVSDAEAEKIPEAQLLSEFDKLEERSGQG